MAKQRVNKTVIILSAILSFVVGFVFSAFTVVYFSLPESGVIPDTQVTRSSNTIASGDLDVDKIANEDLSIHFLELGNKYTGDSTLIKVGDTEILIDAGSRASSVPVIQNYLDQYVTDHKLEYVIVTHAHQDHIAGFGTSTSTDSIFDLYDVGTVIQFVNHNTNSNVYKNYCRELEEVEARCETKVYNALQCVEETDGAQKIYDLSADIKLEILDQDYYHTTTSDENDYSVCCQIIQNDEKYYLFTGDLEANGEASLVARNTLHPVELFKAGHHGSKTSSSNALLSVIQPKIVCVCCCAGSSEYTSNNANQFPTQEFVNRVAPYTDQVFITTLCLDYSAGTFESMNGNIVVYCSRKDEILTLAVACSHNTTILKETDWFKNNRELPDAWAA